MPLPKTAPVGPGTLSVSFTINGQARTIDVEPRAVLLDVLREQLQLFGTKNGCDHGQCGACTIHVNGRRTLSCLSLAVMHEGDTLTTIEGLAPAENELHPIQACFLDHDAYQCGYCTPGQIMSAAAVLREPPLSDDAAIQDAMSGNLCRCGAYRNILAAIREARQRVPA